jgi:hypothetical protein
MSREKLFNIKMGYYLNRNYSARINIKSMPYANVNRATGENFLSLIEWPDCTFHHSRKNNAIDDYK